MKTIKSEIEIQAEELCKEAEDIVDDSYLKTQDARKIINICYKMLCKCKELRESRDNWRNKCKEYKNESVCSN